MKKTESATSWSGLHVKAVCASWAKEGHHKTSCPSPNWLGVYKDTFSSFFLVFHSLSNEKSGFKRLACMWWGFLGRQQIQSYKSKVKTRVLILSFLHWEVKQYRYYHELYNLQNLLMSPLGLYKKYFSVYVIVVFKLIAYLKVNTSFGSENYKKKV